MINYLEIEYEVSDLRNILHTLEIMQIASCEAPDVVSTDNIAESLMLVNRELKRCIKGILEKAGKKTDV